MNTTQNTQHTLPATHQQVPVGLSEYSIKTYQSMVTSRGLADTANLYRGSVLVGTIHGDDFGGQTYLRAASVEEHKTFQDACGGSDEETVLNALMLDALHAQELNKELRKGQLVFVRAGDDVNEPRAIKLNIQKVSLSDIRNMWTKPDYRTGFAKKFGAGAKVWDSQVWVAL